MDYTETIEDLEFGLEENSANWSYSQLILADEIYRLTQQSNQELLNIAYKRLKQFTSIEVFNAYMRLEDISIEEYINNVKKIYSQFLPK